MTVQHSAFKRSLLFPGLGQLHTDNKIKGYSLIASEAVLLGTFIYCQLNYDKARDDYMNETNPSRMQDLYDEYNLYYRGRNVSLILAAGVYIYSLFDVMYFPPEIDNNSETLSLSLQPGMPCRLTLNINLP